MALVGIVAFVTWLGVGSTKVYAVSPNGSLLAAGAPTPIQAGVAGVVTKNALVLGARVTAGDVVVVLDTHAEELKLAQAKATVAALEQSRGIVAELVDAESALVEATTAAAGRKLGSARTRQVAASNIIALRERELTLLDRAHESGVSSGIDALHAAQALDHDRAQLAIQVADTAAIGADLEQIDREGRVRLLTTQRELVEIDGRKVSADAEVASLEWEIARRTLRAPIDGTVADVVATPPGAAVTADQSFGTIVPDAPLKWVAYYAPGEAVGRLKPGQHAKIKLDAFPWTAYGALDGTVTSVGSEAREQRVRVELDVMPSRNITLSHGMTGTADVEVETLPPYRLALRLLGRATETSTGGGE